MTTWTPPPPDFSEGDAGVCDRRSAEELWRAGQEIAAALERRAEAEQDEDERERLGDLADALRGL